MAVEAKIRGWFKLPFEAKYLIRMVNAVATNTWKVRQALDVGPKMAHDASMGCPSRTSWRHWAHVHSPTILRGSIIWSVGLENEPPADNEERFFDGLKWNEHHLTSAKKARGGIRQYSVAQ